MQVPSFIKNIGLRGKILGVIIVILVIVLSTSSFNTYRSFTKKLEADATKSVERSINALKDALNERVLKVKEQAHDQALRPNFIAAVITGNKPQLELLAKKLIENRPDMEIVFFDLNGHLITKVYHEKSEESNYNPGQTSIFVKDGKAGYVVSGKEILIEANAPIINNGQQVGSIVIIRRPLDNNDLVDLIKRNNDSEFTIFNGDTRISTTVEANGKRAIGTKMDDPTVLNAVLKEGKTHFGEIKVVGKTHIAKYEPLPDTDGKPIGMVFAGISKVSIQEAVKEAFIDEIIFQAPLNLIILLVTIYILTRFIINPLVRIIEYATKVADGDLDANIKLESRNDELGILEKALIKMVANLKAKIKQSNDATEDAEQKAILAEQATKEAQESRLQAIKGKNEGLNQAADQLEEVVTGVVEATGEVKVNGNSLNNQITHIADRTADIATAMEEMNSTVLEVARSAGNAADGSGQAKLKAHEGNESMKILSKNLEHVREKVVSLGKMMDGLSVSARDIDQIINVINDIADQTNLLALNAAIEAARAGDAGRGFAVVADEVRKLAEKTQNATKEVSETIRKIQDRVKDGNQMVVSTNETVEVAETSAIQTGKTLKEIVDTSDSTADQVRSIATAAEQQSATSEEINRSISETKELTDMAGTKVENVMRKVADVAMLAEKLSIIQNDLRKAQ